MKGILSILCFIAGLILVACESPYMDIQLALGCFGLAMLLLGAVLGMEVAQHDRESYGSLYRKGR